MVLQSSDQPGLADVIFMIEGTAVNGAYINDLRTNYIIPALEYFRHGSYDEMNYLSASANTLYGIVVYQASDCLPSPSTDTLGPYSSSSRVIQVIEKLELIGGRAESHANIAEGLATALDCFEELHQKRESNSKSQKLEPNPNVQKHCIIICNSGPYLMPVMENHTYAGKTAEHLAVIFQERGINLSIISPRKIPSLYKLFERAGGDLNTSQTKNYSKDPRHLVLLKGFSLKERPISPQSAQNQSILPSANLPLPSLPSPLASNDSPISSVNPQSNAAMMATNVGQGVGVQPGQPGVYRPQNPQGINQLPSHSQPMVTQGMVNVNMVNSARGLMVNNQYQNSTMQAPPGYHAATVGMPGTNRPAPNRWPMLPPQAQQRPFLPQPQQQPTNTQGSALIAQLTQPPSSMSGPVGQFGQMSANNAAAQINQQNQMRLNLLNNQAQQQQPQQQQNVQQVGQQPTVVQTDNSGIPRSVGAPGMGGTIGPNVSITTHHAVPAPNNQVTSQAQSAVGAQASSQPMTTNHDRQTIWQGTLEWIEKPKSSEAQKITRQVPCQVSTGVKDNEPEVKADGWPSKLLMQIMPKQLIGNIGGAYLKNSKSVLFHPQNCDSLEALTKVMSSGFAGCVHFTSSVSNCDIKVLILLYTPDKRVYLGFIPNDQTAFVDRLRKIIQQQKSSQMQRQGQGGAAQPVVSSSMGVVGAGNPLPNSSSQTTPVQQGLMMSQANTVAMGGGQIAQNIVASSSPSGMPGMMGQNVPGGMQPRLRMQIQPGMPQVSSTQVNPSVGNPSIMSSGMMSAGLQRPPFDNTIEAARQQNLEKINQLKQTLEAAQQQEQQFKNQLEIISQMKTTQLQEALQVAQQQEMQYKMLDQQRMAANQGAQGPVNPQQQRIMRPMLNTNNPGLRHLLQQQPQYRQQLMTMQGAIGATGARPQMNQQMPNNPGNPQQFDDVGNFDFM